MIEIKLIPKEKITEFCAQNDLAYSPALKIYAATEKGEPLGCCGFAYSGAEGELLFTSMAGPGLAPIEDGIVRSTLSYMLESGVKSASCRGGVPERQLRVLGFKEKDGVYKLDLTDSFLTRGECGEK